MDERRDERAGMPVPGVLAAADIAQESGETGARLAALGAERRALRELRELLVSDAESVREQVLVARSEDDVLSKELERVASELRRLEADRVALEEALEALRIDCAEQQRIDRKIEEALEPMTTVIGGAEDEIGIVSRSLDTARAAVARMARTLSSVSGDAKKGT